MKFSEIYKEAEENARLAILSLWTPGPHPMRKAIENLLKREPLLAEPVFQSTFGWQVTSDNNWRTYLNADVISRLEIGQRNIPYLHQSESWKKLHEGKSIVVTSGTGSGKTECFMYPVLSDLYEQMQEGVTNKIQAIFLYPLNALMEDQKERLYKNCSAVDANLRFAVYNGNTPERRLNNDMEPWPNEIATREDIRNIRPQILLSNPSMLEYILVRKADQEMLQESAGSLRWIVIDEAHSYSGSAAVELSYQIKRILDAFGTDISQVRFVCTSATIGGIDGEQKLKDFISTLTGKPADDIQVIGGSRVVPELDREELSRQLAADNLPAVERVLNLREKINEVPGMNLQQICDILCPEIQSGQTDADNKIIRLLGILDKLCDLKINDSPVLSLRAHFFMRTISGLYACCNEHCAGADGTPFGYITTREAGICPECGRPLLEILQCKDCNSFILSGHRDGNTHEISPLDTSEYDAEDDENYNALYVKGSKIYYIISKFDDNYDYQYYLCSVNKKGLNQKNICKLDENIDYINMQEDAIYYTITEDYDSYLIKTIKYNGTDKEVIKKVSDLSNINITKDWVVFLGENDEYDTIMKMIELDGNEEKEL